MIYKVLLCGLLIASRHNAYASQWLERKAEGWAWYEEMVQDQERECLNCPALETSVEKIQNIRGELEEKLSLAILEPTLVNIRSYLTMQKEWMERSSEFSHTWAKVVLNHPELDQTRITPVSQIGSQYAQQNRTLIAENRLQEIGNDHALLFVFDSKSGLSQHMAGVVKEFERRYKWKVVAVSTDGKGIPQYPNPITDNGITNHITLVSTPALCTIHPVTEQIRNIGVGSLTIEQIRENILRQHLGGKWDPYSEQ